MYTLYEELILDGDVRMGSMSMVFSCCPFPLEGMLRGCTNLGFAAVVDIAQRLGIQCPFKRFDIGGGFAGLKNHVEQRTTLEETQERGIAVVTIEFLKVSPKRVADQWFERFLARMLAIESIKSENIAWDDFRFQAKLDVIAQ